MTMQQTSLSRGNEALRNKDYKAAIRHYNRALAQNPELAAMLQNNIDLAYKRGGIPKPATGAVTTETVDIVVPVYNALEDVKKCLESLQRCTDGLSVTVIVVNDGSDDTTSQWLRDYCSGKPAFKLIEHETNAGYTKAVNTGLKATTADYAITQNSDTIVSPGWLTGLIRCMNSSPTIGIVGPLSNAANWQNIPELRDESGGFAINQLPVGYSVDDMAELVRHSSFREYPRLRVINGFCFMIRRSVIEAIGYMDEETFPVGYGEEEDYCIRAVDSGFELAVADDVFVYHAKSKSFGHERRKQLSEEGSSKLRAKHQLQSKNAITKTVRQATSLEKLRKRIQEATKSKPSKHVEGETHSIKSDSTSNPNIAFRSFRETQSGGSSQEPIDSSICKHVAVLVHYYYPEIWPDIADRLQHIDYPFHLFITCSHERAEQARRDVNTKFPTAIFFVGPNLGMDIVPFLQAIPKLHKLGYKVVCKIQTKRGVDSSAVVWRSVMLDTLIGSSHNFSIAASALLRQPNLSMVGPASLYQSGPRLMLGNRDHLDTLTRNLFGIGIPEEPWGFFAGTMFWVKVSTLLELSKLVDIGHPALTKEYRQDGKIEHALERLFGLIPPLTNKTIGLLHPTQRGFTFCTLTTRNSGKYINEMGVGAQLRQIARLNQDTEIIKNSGVFDSTYYLEHYPELREAGADALHHYLTHGHQKDFPFNRQKFDLKGLKEHLRATGDSRLPIVAYSEDANLINRLLDPKSKLKTERANIFDKQSMNNSGLFDFDFYLSQFHIKPHTEIDLLQHYLEVGSYDEMLPNRWFVPREYRKLNPDVVAARYDAFYHYLVRGAQEGRRYRENKIREERESPFYRYMNLNASLINWQTLTESPPSSDIVSIVIPVLDQPELTKSCITSIYEANTQCSFEVVCVDNGSATETQDLLVELSKRHSNFKLLRNGENFNFALGCNLGFSKIEGRVVVFLNNDTTVTDHWLDILVSSLEDPDVAAVQPKLLFPDGTVQNIGIVFGLLSPFGYPVYEHFSGRDSVASSRRKCQAVTAACIALRSADFAKFRGFDTRYINGQEDVDLCLRMTHGSERYCLVEPRSVVIHHESKTKGRGKFISLNRQTFLSRWKTVIKPDDIHHYRKDGYALSSYLLDSEEMEAQGIPIRRPVIERTEKGMRIIPKVRDSSQLTPFRFFNGALFPDYSELPQFAIVGDAEIRGSALNVCMVAHASGSHIFGSERSFLDMLRAVSQLSCNIIVCFPECPSSEYIEEVLGFCKTIYVFSYNHWHSGAGHDSQAEAIRLFKYIYSIEAVDLCYVNTIMMRDASEAAKGLQIPVITHTRELITHDETLRSYIGLPSDEIVSEVYARSSAVLCNSQATAAMFPSKLKLVIARNVVNIEEFDMDNVIRDGKVKFGLISSNVPKKGIRDFFRIADICKVTAPNARFCLIGPINDYVNELSSEFNTGAADSNVQILGYIPNSRDAISEVNVILSLSYFAESFGRTIAEAFAGERPGLAYDRGAISELITHEVNGMLTPFGDVTMMASYVSHLTANWTTILELGKRGKQTVRDECNSEQLKSKIAKSFALSLTGPTLDGSLRIKLERRLDSSPSDWIGFLNGFTSPASVIVPIFNAYEHVVELISSIESSPLPCRTRFLFINDGSTDLRIRNFFTHLETQLDFDYIENDVNIGYTSTINKGIRLCGRDDIVLLNSDTFVTGCWLTGLKVSAYLRANIGTATSMSDNAGAFSFPHPNTKNSIIAGENRKSHAEIVINEASKFDDIALPTGNGFCMYIKRRLIDHIGLFDAESFPRGYGEENDFCMRAISAGFINVLSTSSFVYHVKSASFGSQREQLVNSGNDMLIRLHPSYHKLVSDCFGGSEISNLRSAIDSLY